jgi:hypothetical protein
MNWLFHSPSRVSFHRSIADWIEIVSAVGDTPSTDKSWSLVQIAASGTNTDPPPKSKKSKKNQDHQDNQGENAALHENGNRRPELSVNVPATQEPAAFGQNTNQEQTWTTILSSSEEGSKESLVKMVAMVIRLLATLYITGLVVVHVVPQWYGRWCSRWILSRRGHIFVRVEYAYEQLTLGGAVSTRTSLVLASPNRS